MTGCQWPAVDCDGPLISHCDQPAAYRVLYSDCLICSGIGCIGTALCTSHTAQERHRWPRFVESITTIEDQP